MVIWNCWERRANLQCRRSRIWDWPNTTQFLSHYFSFHQPLQTSWTSLSISLSLFPVAPYWSVGHPWKALFHFSFLILGQSVGLFWRGISPSQSRYLHSEQHKHRINSDTHPCFEWDSNPRSQCSSGRRQSLWIWEISILHHVSGPALNCSSPLGIIKFIFTIVPLSGQGGEILLLLYMFSTKT
jgi:hypothetical protein